MENLKTALLCVLCLTLCLSCRMIDTLTNNGSAGTVENLWSDVPPFDGATKTDVSIPLGARLAIRAFMQGKINFITFTTDRSAQDVQNFYTKERMKSAGWKMSDKGCMGDTEGKKSQGAVCFFNREDGDKKEGLAIILAEDEKSKQTDIFYARIDLSEEKATPTP